MDMSKMLKDLQKMQSKMLKAQNDLRHKTTSRHRALTPKPVAEW